jgi:hypothetical protein
MATYKIRSEVWLYPGATAAWHFVSLSRKQSEDIDKRFRDKRRGWNSFPVLVKLGSSTWKTSIFYDKREGAYILPLKASMRKKEGIKQGNRVSFKLEVLN